MFNNGNYSKIINIQRRESANRIAIDV